MGVYEGAYTNGEVEDYIYFKKVTLALISDFSAYRSGDRVVVRWSTSFEIGTVGFDLLRLDPATGEYAQVNEDLLPSVNAYQGGVYRFVDEGAAASGEHTYQLVELDAQGKNIPYGPFKVRVKDEGQAVSGGYEAVAHRVSTKKAARAEASKASKAKAKQDQGKRTGAAIKIAVSESGLYYLDAAKIASLIKMNTAQVSALLKDGKLELQTQGQKVPYVKAAGNAGIYFYGQRIESPYTDENVYWLQQSSALRMTEVKGKGPAAVSGVQTFSDTIHVEQDRRALPGLFKDPQADYWFWDYVMASAGYDRKSFMLSAPGAQPGAATLTVHVRGTYDSPASLDHHIVVSLNGQQIGEGRWGGGNPYDLTIASDALPLNDGDNTLEVQAVLDAGVPFSIFYVDSFDLTYNARLSRGEQYTPPARGWKPGRHRRRVQRANHLGL